MATKAELLEQAKARGLDVKTSSTVKELESMLKSSNEGSSDSNETETPKERAKSETSRNKTSGTRKASETDKNRTRQPSSSEVTVNENEGGEATNGTTREGDESPIKNGEEVKQNGVSQVEVIGGDNNTDVEGDESRSETEVKFADEGNPDNKARYTGAGGGEYDQDGHQRTGGKSYGVADDTNEDISPDVFQSNRGEEPKREGRYNAGEWFNSEIGSEGDTNNQEWDEEKRKSLEDSLSEPDEGIRAKVTIATGDYVRVKFFRNGLAFGTFKSRKFEQGEAQAYLDELKESRGL